MRSVGHFAVALAIFILVGFVFWSHRERVAAEALQFSPSTTQPGWLPAGTAIDVEIRSGITSSSEVGDTVTAFVSLPVVYDERDVIPVGTPLRGSIEKLTVTGTNGDVQMNFTRLFLSGRWLDIRTRGVLFNTAMQSDVEIIGTALGALMRATLGSAIGAGTGDIRVIDRALLEAARNSDPVEPTVPITVILLADSTL